MVRDNLVIRRARSADAPKVIATINSVGEEGVWLATEHYVPTDQWEQALHHPEMNLRTLLLVSQAEGEIVGWCRVFPYTFGGKSLHVGDVGLGVQKEFRQRGIGRALLENAISLAQKQGYEKLTLDLYASNKIARHLFETFGFHVIGIRARQAKFKNAYVDEILMEREL